MKILVITDSLPYPLNSGPRIRIYNLMQRMATRHQLWLASLIQEHDDSTALGPLGELCEQVVIAKPYRGSPISHLPGIIRYALAGMPLEL